MLRTITPLEITSSNENNNQQAKEEIKTDSDYIEESYQIASELYNKLYEIKKENLIVFDLSSKLFESVQAKILRLKEIISKIHDTKFKIEEVKAILLKIEEFNSRFNTYCLSRGDLNQNADTMCLLLDSILEHYYLILTDESIRNIFVFALRSSEQTRQQFLALNSTMKIMASKLVYKIYVDGSKERLDFEIGKYFYSPAYSSLNADDIAFLLTHPNATPNLYVFIEIIDTHHFTNSASKIFFIRAEELCNAEKFIASFNRVMLQYSFLLKPADKNIKYSYHYGKFKVKALIYHVLLEKHDRRIELLMNAKAEFNLFQSLTDLQFSLDNDNFFINNKIINTSFDIKKIFIQDESSILLEDSIKNDNELLLSYLLNYLPKSIIEAYDKIRSAIKQAVDHQSKKAIKLLLESGVDMTKVSIHDAARIGDKNLIAYFLNQGVDINKKNSQQLTPLAIAIKFENLDTIDFLIEKKANLYEVEDNEIPSWLKHAILTWNLQIFKKCLALYLSMNCQENPPKIYIQEIFDYLVNVDNLDQFPLENKSIFDAKHGYMIYVYLINELSLTKWGILNEFGNILINKNEDRPGYAYIKSSLIGLFSDVKEFGVDPLGNTLLHYFLQWPIFNDFCEPLHLRVWSITQNYANETAYHYVCKKFYQSKNTNEKATYLKNIYDLSAGYIPCLSIDSSGNLPGDYLLKSSFKKEWQDPNFQLLCHKFVFPIILKLFTDEAKVWKGYTRLHKAVVDMTADDLDCLLTALKKIDNYNFLILSKNKQSILHVAAHCNKIENLKVIAKHNIVKITSTHKFIPHHLIKDNEGKIAMDYAKRNDVINELALISGNSLTSLDADHVIDTYQKDKIFISSKATKQVIFDLKNQPNNYLRFFVAEKYINDNPQKRFASHLRPKIEKPVRTLTNEIVKLKK